MITKYKRILFFVSVTVVTAVFMFGKYVHIEEYKETIQHQSWVILGFTDINYLPVTKLWYKQLSEIGYHNHMIIALDDKSYNNVTKQGQYRCERGAGKIQGKGFESIVKLRVATVLEYLEKRKNVFVSDVDSYWNYYFDLNKLPPHYDTFHAIATTWPPDVFKKWGFTLCTCIAGYRANNKTIHLVRKILNRCGEKCSDQEVTNKIHGFVFDVKWHENVGVSLAYNLTVNAFKKDFVARSEINCKSWISMNRSQKSLAAKLRGWKYYTKQCRKNTS